ncbi:hypothetical protein ACFSSA_12710 [Luteolibacter algae]|uniref:Glycine zipper 2TM domain-containing protein n=1 Tax=Luteolibacter algae TaxID=454151 RepID=A0ABW5DBT9_9BACT
MTRLKLTAAAIAGGVLVSCTPYQQQGAAVGALGGGAIGAIAGDGSRDAVRGAALGAALGTGVAALQENQQRENRNRYDNGFDQQGPYPSERPAPSRDQYPTAERTDNRDQVLSPYPPYNVIDVQGFRSGQLAKDPSNGKIFRVP